MTEINIRYIVDDIDAAIDFYTTHLAFETQARPGPGFAMLHRTGLRLLLNTPGAGGAGHILPDGTTPTPGGWNRIQIQVDDLDATITELQRAGASFCSDKITGRGGSQILLPDPAGNLVELFQPSTPENGHNR